MSKYDKYNGVTMQNQIGADEEDFYIGVLRAVNGARECERREKDSDNATRSFINKTALSIEEEIEKEKLNKEKEKLNKEKEKLNKEKDGKQEENKIPSYYIAASIKDYMKDVKNNFGNNTELSIEENNEENER